MAAGQLLEMTKRTMVVNTDVDEMPTDGDKAFDVLGGNCQLYRISGKNNDGSAVYLDVWNAASPDVGTDSPDYRFRLTASKSFGPFRFGGEGGHVLSVGLSYAGVTAAGGSTGATNLDVSMEAKKL